MILFNKSRLKGSAATLNNRKRLYDPMSLAGAADYSEKESDRLRVGRLTFIEDFALEHSLCRSGWWVISKLRCSEVKVGLANRRAYHELSNLQGS